MAKYLQFGEIDDTVKNKPESASSEVFKAEKKLVNGKEMYVVKTRNEVITKPDGSQDVIIHAPSLDLMNKFQQENS